MKPYEKILEEKFRPHSLLHKGPLVLQLEKIDSFIAECEDLQLAIIGFEGIEVVSGQATPFVEETSDYGDIAYRSWDSFRQKVNDATREYMLTAKNRDNFGYELVVIDQTEFNSSQT